MTQRLTLGYLTLNAPPADTITAAAEAGFKSVGIRITGRRLADPYTQVVGNPEMIREIRKRVADGDIQLSNISAYHFYPDVTWDHIKGVVETTAELGAKIIVANTYIADEARFLDLFSRYCEAANTHGIRLAIEFMRYSACKTIEQAARLVEKSGHPNAGFLIDPLHLNRSGGTPEAIKKIDPKRIVFVQLCDAMLRKDNPTDQDLMAEARTARLRPGSGELPLHDFLDALPQDVEIEYEVPRPEEVNLPLRERAEIAAKAFYPYLEKYRASSGRKSA
jgi:sugar phosphate isomerase/epimerase